MGSIILSGGSCSWCARLTGRNGHNNKKNIHQARSNYLAGEEALSNVQGNASQSQERKILEI